MVFRAPPSLADPLERACWLLVDDGPANVAFIIDCNGRILANAQRPGDDESEPDGLWLARAGDRHGVFSLGIDRADEEEQLETVGHCTFASDDGARFAHARRFGRGLVMVALFPSASGPERMRTLVAELTRALGEDDGAPPAVSS